VILVQGSQQDEVYRNRLGSEEYFGPKRGQYRSRLDTVIDTHFYKKEISCLPHDEQLLNDC